MTPNENAADAPPAPLEAAAEAQPPEVVGETPSEPELEYGSECAADGAGPAPEADDADDADVAPPPRTPPYDPRDARIRFLESQLVEKEATLHSYIRAHKKAEQEFEAFKARLLRDQEREVTLARGKVVEKMLDVDANLERTLEAAQRSGAGDSLLEGLRLVHRQFVERLTELGLERIDPTGQPFDPTTMEALGVAPVTDPALDNIVMLTLRAGFRLGDRELRPALVQVGRVF